MTTTTREHVGIIGGGPSGLFMLKALLQHPKENRQIHIFERSAKLGAGMPYSSEGAEREHITNVSANEIPEMVTSVSEWLESVPEEVLALYRINRNHFNEYKVLPRLLFGDYLQSQFLLLVEAAERANVSVKIHTEADVTNIREIADNKTQVTTASGEIFTFDKLIICTGHHWTTEHEGKIDSWFDSPYPPKKLQFTANHKVAIKGSSLTAIDAIRTLARHNGTFEYKDGELTFKKNEQSPDFELVLHSRSGLLPAVRFHLEDTHLKNNKMLTEQEIDAHIEENGGFLSLDYLFEHNFKKLLIAHDEELYGKVAEMNLEEFTSLMMDYREDMEPFDLFNKEFENADRSIAEKKSIYWKELLAMLSFALNYPAKHLSAEDMMRLQKSLMPLISIIIAFVPQASGAELIALHKAKALKIIPVGGDSEVEPVATGGAIYRYKNYKDEYVEEFYHTFVDCVGQPHLSLENFPFQELANQVLSPATLPFRSSEAGKTEMEQNKKVIEQDGRYFLKVPGVRINDFFQVIDKENNIHDSLFLMAVPYIGGYNPDYSGLDFCEEASKRIASKLHLTAVHENLT